MDEKEKMRILAGNGYNRNQINETKIYTQKEFESIEIIDKYDYLKKAFKYILLKNKSNFNPYHNLNHLMTVLKYCYQ